MISPSSRRSSGTPPITNRPASRSVSQQIGTLIQISRPRFWLYTAGPFLLGYILGLPNGYRQLYPFSFFALLLFFLIPANLFIYGINDLFDRATDELNAKKAGKEHRLQPADYRMLAISLIVTVMLGMVVFIWLPGWLRGWFVLFAALCTLYSAPPIRFKARPFVDSYSNALYVIPGFIGFGLTAGVNAPVVAMLGAWAWAAGMHAYSAMPDIVPDRAAHIATVATVLGARRTLLFVGFNWLIAAGTALLTVGLPGLLFFAYIVVIFILYTNPGLSVERAYWYFPVINAVIGFLAFVTKTLSS